MKTRLEQVLERNLNEREIAIWGTPTRPLLRALEKYKYRIADTVDIKKHYVVAVNGSDIDDFFASGQGDGFEHVNNFLIFEDEGGELPFDWECHGVKIGRETYFGEGFVGGCKDGYFESIGHFTSINCSADIGVNHQLNMVFTSDDIAELFTDENKKIFQNKLRNDNQHPYAHGKKRITVGSDVYIGANAFINASKVTYIGDGAIIGAGAVVMENVPPYAVAVGVPAKIKRYRFSPEMIETLLRIKWWNWSVDEINANADALMSPKLFQARFMKQ
jgi:aminocyclitol acetyltransferase